MKNNELIVNTDVMEFTSPKGRKIRFDDFVDHTEEYGLYLANLCPSCRNKYRNVLKGKVTDDGSKASVCSVEECENGNAHYLVDFDSTEVKIIKPEENEKIKKIMNRDELWFRRKCYELYKLDWLERHIAWDRVKDEYRQYLSSQEDKGNSFEDYIEDSGFSSELYVSFYEFLDTEYRDEKYMQELLGEEVFQAYKKWNYICPDIMEFTSPRGKKIRFDDFVDNTAEYGSYWANMCPTCRNKYRSILKNRVTDDGSDTAVCSVEGCSKGNAHYYVDFDSAEVEIVKTEEKI